MRRNLVWWILLGVGGILWAQQSPVLMRVNGKAFTRSDFESMYGNRHTSPGKEKQDRVDSFITFRLKVDAAERAGLDTTSIFNKELAVYRKQLADSFLRNEKAEGGQLARLYNDWKYSMGEEVWITQIFIRFPQTVSSFRLREAQTQMDSVYQVLKANPQTDFSSFVNRFSDDKKTSCIRKLSVSEEFEQVVFALRPGEISSPFLSPQGIHIVKVLKRSNTALDKKESARIERRFSHRQTESAETMALVEKLKKEYRYSVHSPGLEELLQKGVTNQTLFELDGHDYSGEDFERFAVAYPQEVRKQYELFVAKTILDYENSRLDKKYLSFRQSLNWHRDSLLVAGITQKEMDDRMAHDKNGLEGYFDLHQSDYQWEKPRFKGVVLHSVDKKTAKIAKKLVKKFPEAEWKQVLQRAFSVPGKENVQVEQGLYAEGENKYVDKLAFRKGDFEALKSYPFTTLIGDKLKGPETCEEAYRQVYPDYIEFLKTQWIKSLRANGKVEINEEVLKSVNNH